MMVRGHKFRVVLVRRLNYIQDVTLTGVGLLHALYDISSMSMFGSFFERRLMIFRRSRFGFRLRFVFVCSSVS